MQAVSSQKIKSLTDVYSKFAESKGDDVKYWKDKYEKSEKDRDLIYDKLIKALEVGAAATEKAQTMQAAFDEAKRLTSVFEGMFEKIRVEKDELNKKVLDAYISWGKH